MACIFLCYSCRSPVTMLVRTPRSACPCSSADAHSRRHSQTSVPAVARRDVVGGLAVLLTWCGPTALPPPLSLMYEHCRRAAHQAITQKPLSVAGRQAAQPQQIRCPMKPQRSRHRRSVPPQGRRQSCRRASPAARPRGPPAGTARCSPPTTSASSCRRTSWTSSRPRRPPRGSVPQSDPLSVRCSN